MNGVGRVEAPRLFDPPGRLARRRIRAMSVFTVAVLALAAAGVVYRFQASGQLSAAAWSPFGRGSILRYLLAGAERTAYAALAGGVLALPLGLAGALGRVSRRRWLRRSSIVLVEVLRAIPLLLIIYVVLLLLPRYGVRLSPYWMLVVPLALTNGAALAEIIRAGMLSVPSGQREAALSLGLSERQTLGRVVLPQGVRHVLPALVSQLIYLLKGTTLGYIVSYDDLLNHGQTLAEYTRDLVQTYLVVALIYLLINLALSRMAHALEGRRRTSAPPPGLIPQN